MNNNNDTYKTIVFGGWAVSPYILKCNFGDNAHYVDVNKIMPNLFDDGGDLCPDWEDTVSSLYRSDSSESDKGVARNVPTSNDTYDAVVGWSTGAMFAYALARACPPRKLILLSATPSFCRRDDFRFGTRPAVLDQMIAALATDRDAVLASFYERCGLRYDANAVSEYTTDELTLGLRFLKLADLRPLSPLPSTDIVFRHGSDDAIIPQSAAAYFRDQTGGTLRICEGDHTFFTTSPLP